MLSTPIMEKHSFNVRVRKVSGRIGSGIDSVSHARERVTLRNAIGLVGVFEGLLPLCFPCILVVVVGDSLLVLPFLSEILDPRR